MRIVSFYFLFLIVNIGWSQSIQSRISNVENRIIFPKIFSDDIKTHQIHLLQSLKKHKISGASVAVVHNGKLHWSKAYGVVDANTNEIVTTKTLFQCASIGKMITAIAALKLVEQGKLSLDENVNNKLKRWKIHENSNTKTQSVTLRYLLSHSAGLTDDYGFLGYNPKNTIPDLLQILNNHKSTNVKKSLTVKTIPGTIERYSGGGYLIIQLLIEDITRMPFADYIQEQVFSPLEMKYTTYEYQPDKTIRSSIATGHRSNGKPFKNKKYHIYPEKAAAGPWTTAEDLAKLVIGIQNAIHNQNHSILSKKLVDEFITPQINYKGLGVNLRGINKPKAFWHAGQNLGYTALLYGLIDSKDGAIVLLNSEGGEILMQEFISSVSNEYQWPVMQAHKNLEISQEQKLALAGVYEDVKGTKNLTVEIKNEALIVKSSEAKKELQLYKIDENHYTFRDAQDYYKLSFKYQNNKVISLIYKESIGKQIELIKLN